MNKTPIWPVLATTIACIILAVTAQTQAAIKQITPVGAQNACDNSISTTISCSKRSVLDNCSKHWEGTTGTLTQCTPQTSARDSLCTTSSKTCVKKSL